MELQHVVVRKASSVTNFRDEVVLQVENLQLPTPSIQVLNPEAGGTRERIRERGPELVEHSRYIVEREYA